MTDLDDILAAIAALPRRQREHLWRRARQMGLLPEEAGLAGRASSRAGKRLVPRSVPAAMTAQTSLAGDLEKAPVRPAGDPGSSAPSRRQHRVKIIFDGGSKGNPGQGYGSFALEWDGEAEPVQRLTFGPQMTNNEAEYDTLIAALQAILLRLDESDILPGQVALDIWGDSKLVISQVRGDWKINEERLGRRCRQAQTLLKRFGAFRLHHQPRSASVAVLGH